MSLIRHRHENDYYNKFIQYTHYVLDPIQGKKTINDIFKDLDKTKLNNLIYIYNNTCFERYYKIHELLQKYNLLNKDNYEDTFITSIYICAIQHFTCQI